ncbi:MAG: amino acid transporter [Candidatus Marivariicella framensis]|jgi:amino acid transporter|tara:strand:+ start:1639 stop:2043 length:405 start_codon:yes stop_codon:yes gene_type:complete
MWKTYHLIKVSLSAALAGIICCIGPVVLFQFGLMSGVYAISFADFFYAEDGSIGTGAIILRVIGLFIVIIGVISYNKKEDCSVNSEKQKKINKILFAAIVLVISISLFFTLDEFSSIYFDKYIVPQQQIELNIK